MKIFGSVKQIMKTVERTKGYIPGGALRTMDEDNS